ncbi:hypothetical protein CALCODRAFT_60587 [Calocera cornea HHB12733]|uniref:Uncharacterized protein n=1 Tax=Calocera cornea HHB12733 TaxID=1353952 RepID=A0A165DN77_9BASI|nr:hypothetical protein CALCODRAFT_60587 [Calocera cornea HHB12733]
MAWHGVVTCSSNTMVGSGWDCEPPCTTCCAATGDQYWSSATYSRRSVGTQPSAPRGPSSQLSWHWRIMDDNDDASCPLLTRQIKRNTPPPIALPSPPPLRNSNSNSNLAPAPSTRRRPAPPQPSPYPTALPSRARVPPSPASAATGPSKSPEHLYTPPLLVACAHLHLRHISRRNSPRCTHTYGLNLVGLVQSVSSSCTRAPGTPFTGQGGARP